MARLIQIDLDDLLDRIQDASSNAPSLIEQAAALGVNVPVSASKYLGLAGIGAQLFKKVIPRGKGTGLEFDGMPDTGPIGRGRTSYIRNRSKFQDKDVVYALNSVMSVPGIKAAKEIEATLAMTMSIMNPGSEDTKSDSQVRSAVDRILENEKLDSEVWEKFGDLIYFCLTTIDAPKEK